jgi:hypothetical protein
MEVGDESIAACAHNINKDDKKKLRRLMMIVFVLDEIKQW